MRIRLPARRTLPSSGAQDLDRDLAAEPGVASAIDLTHATLPERIHHFVRPELIASRKAHPPASYRTPAASRPQPTNSGQIASAAGFPRIPAGLTSHRA